jgi:hypothetical protein
MARVPLKMTVNHRNDWGRFAAHYEHAGEQTVRDAIEEGARMSRALAPVGHKHDMRTIPLRESIEPVMETRTKGHWVARARHAAPIEFGGRPHPITAMVNFFWESAGRWWVPGLGWINHPGNPPQPYMRPAYEAVKRRMSDIARKNYRSP